MPYHKIISILFFVEIKSNITIYHTNEMPYQTFEILSLNTTIIIMTRTQSQTLHLNPDNRRRKTQCFY